ncbi:tetratricopeptide repeat protein [Klebsiella aerogenes]|uniref:tetratricopeptide repeat protein n=1 Tax=Klebsiella aerogenes TaxID=548 RepID=UPI0011EBD4BC|nr:tetratricopeptide repeat protein [Klebsiella aerogenes]KAA0470811.1 tetratricopeptide repeat protein [Klebsiella aerogenes]HBX2114123.1 tetratricopeptide repeat protein [Klebsiella aerogenes]
MKELENPRIESKVNSFVEKGNELHDDKKYAQALEQYKKAWNILPEPKPEWQVANWISANIFSAYFDLGDYNEAKKWGEMTLQTRGSEIDTAPSIDLGMVCYELEQFDEAYKYFNDAYSYGKERAFKGRPKKYLEFFLNKRA